MMLGDTRGFRFLEKVGKTFGYGWMRSGCMNKGNWASREGLPRKGKPPLICKREVNDNEQGKRGRGKYRIWLLLARSLGGDGVD